MSSSVKKTAHETAIKNTAIKNAALAVSVSAALFLSGCGFSPLYATAGGTGQGSVADYLDTVAIGSIPDESGQYLRNALIDRLYRHGRPSA